MAKSDNMNDSLNDAAVISAFKDKTKEMFHELEGLNPEAIEANVKQLVQDIINTYNLDATIEDVVVSGSRCRGMETEGSDLDVVLYYSGSERENSLFNTLHEGGNIIMGGVSLDINPISQEQRGSLSEYLSGVETYLAEKQAQEAQKQAVITFTVAECGEFHSMGAYHEGIATIEEAKSLYDSMQKKNNNMITAVGINVHEIGTPEMDDIQWDVLYGNAIDLDNLRYVPEIWNDREALAKVGQLIDAFQDAKVRGELPGLVVQDMSVGMDGVKPVYVDEAAKLAAEIDRFSSDRYPSEYKDTVDNWEAQVQNMAAEIRSGNAGDYKKYLADVVSESDNIEDVRKAAELLVKLAEYKPLAKVEELEEENLNQIDNYLSNTVPKAEERKEIRNAEQERIEEEEKKRRAKGERPSLRARLAEKKAIVAAAGANPQLEKQRQVQNEVLFSQRESGKRFL
ncbi:MAG: nucleotidyltransferase domain-containing protein [Oribacterium sp.]|nr:nucleotidyltransferase domain-containing protein [Oribacterium sp.]MBP3804802.1 nucleotidyltransferase domain-containing protein [Oribacterium sp.]